MERSPAGGFQLTVLGILSGALSQQICPFASDIQCETSGLISLHNLQNSTEIDGVPLDIWKTLPLTEGINIFIIISFIFSGLQPVYSDFADQTYISQDLKTFRPSLCVSKDKKHPKSLHTACKKEKKNVRTCRPFRCSLIFIIPVIFTSKHETGTTEGHNRGFEKSQHSAAVSDMTPAKDPWPCND